jgi:hypothetical protein
MPIDPELAAALRTQLRRPAIAWLVVMVAAGAGYGGLHYAHQQAQQAQLTLQAQQSALQQEQAQTEADLQLVLRHRADYQRWQADGLIGPLPVAEWRAQQLQALAQALQALAPWASERVTLQMQPSQALVLADAPGAATAAPDPAATPGENPSAPPTTVHPLSIQGRGTDDLQALAALNALQNQWRSAGQILRCELKRVTDSGTPPLAQVDWACDAQLYYVQQAPTAPAAATPAAPEPAVGIAPAATGVPIDPDRWPTWLLTPAERAALARPATNAANAADADSADPAYGPWRLDGWASPQQRPGSAWINGRLVQTGDSLADGVRVGRIEAGHLTLWLDGRPYRLRPGQILLPDGSVLDMLPQPVQPSKK